MPFQREAYRSDLSGTIADLMGRGTANQAELIRANAAIQARAAEQRGQNTAQLFGTIGQLAQGTMHQIQQDRIDAPKRELDRLQLEDAHLKIDDAKRTAAEDRALRDLFARGQETRPEEIYQVVGPKRGAEILKGFASLRSEQFKEANEVRQAIGQAMGGVLALPETMRAEAYGAVRTNMLGRGVHPSELPEAYSPDAVQQFVAAAISPDKQYEIANPKPIPVPPNYSLVNPQHPQDGPIYTAPAAPKETPKPTAGSFEDYVTRYAAERHLEPAQLSTKDVENARKRYGQADDRPPSVTINGQLAGATDPKAIADAIRNGSLPPVISEYGRAVQGAVASELARSGFNLSAARSDWTAAQKHFQTLNGAQQTRIRQGIDVATHSLDVIDDLASQWDAARIVKGGKLLTLNSVELAAAKSGVYGDKAQSIATQLEGQITDVVSELGNVYMGGNSPTDHALKLAEKNLRADWSARTLKDMTQLARTNLTIRANSITNVGAVSTGGTNTYTAPANEPTAPGIPPAVRDTLHGQKDGRYTLSDGSVWTVQGGTVRKAQ